MIKMYIHSMTRLVADFPIFDVITIENGHYPWSGFIFRITVVVKTLRSFPQFGLVAMN